MGIGRLRALRNAVVGFLVLALLAGMFLPIYTDEVGWRFQERAAVDGVDKLYSETCGENTLAVPPLFMMPVRYYSAFFNTSFADPFYVRLSGVLYALLATFLLLVLIRRIVENERDRTVITIIAAGLMTLGTLPLLLVWSRPEQPIILAGMAALLVAWSDWKDMSSPVGAWRAWQRSLAIVVLSTIAISYHFKGIALLPLFLVCLFFASRGRASYLPRFVAAAVILAFNGWAAEYWVGRLQCPNDPILWETYSAHSVGAALTNVRDGHGLMAVLGKLFINMSPLEYFGSPAPREHPMSEWLEPGQVSFAVFSLWGWALRLLWSAALFAALAGLFVSLRTSVRERRLDPKPILALTLLGIVLVWSATQLVRNIYEASFVLPLTMLAIVFGLAAMNGQDRIRGILSTITMIVGSCALVSPVVIAAIYVPSLIRANSQQGYIEAQRFSVTGFGYPELRKEILGAARQCRLPSPEQARALMIDDLTYFTFIKSRLPQHYLGVTGGWKGTIADPLAYLKSRGSDGIIVGCHLLPDDLRRRATRQGGFCCIRVSE